MANPSDTIFALATGAGKSAVAIVRVSGPKCSAIRLKLCNRSYWPPREAVYASLFDENGTLIDRAIVIVFEAPRSFTGEDMIEFQITGGRGVKLALLRNLSQISGTRVAEPGEFARRAFANGKLDLTQVEGLANIVDAETEAEARHAALVAFGAVSRECELARVELLQVASQLEGALDFSDVEDPDGSSSLKVRACLERSLCILKSLSAGARVTERLRSGFTVAIIGKPNAGKSTLVNCILQRDAVIVSEIPGTTRDYLEFFVELSGFPIVFVDTAGFREALDPIELLGIQKSRDRIRAADLILWVSESGFEPDAFVPGNLDTIKVLSKCDLPNGKQASDADLVISAVTREGFSDLINMIVYRAERFFEDYTRPGLGSERQLSAVLDAVDGIENVLKDMAQPEELIAEEVRAALAAIGRVTGRVDVEHVLDEVFSRLCIGK